MSTETNESPKKIDPTEALQRITESYHGLYNGLGYFIDREEGEIAHNETFYQVAMEDFENAPGPVYFEAVQQHIAELEAQVRTAGAEALEGEPNLTPESEQWKQVCDALDAIWRKADEAIQKGACQEDWALLDRRLQEIQQASAEARMAMRKEARRLRAGGGA